MSTQITTAFTKQYDSGCQLVAQQVESRVRDRAMIKNMTGAEKAYVEYVGKTDPVARTTRHGDTVYTDTPHIRRMLVTTPYNLADLIDKPDEVRCLIDPLNPYTQAFRAGFNRKVDTILFEALRGTSYSGPEGATPITLPSAQKVVHAGVGLTVGKLMDAQEILDVADVPDEDEGGENYSRWMAISPRQVKNMLQEVEVGSADYNLLKPLVDGKIVRFMGFNFIKSNRLYSDGTYRYCLAWIKAGVYLGMNYDITSTVDRMPGKQNSTQIFMEMMLGASRCEEEMVVEIACLE